MLVGSVNAGVSRATERRTENEQAEVRLFDGDNERLSFLCKKYLHKETEKKEMKKTNKALLCLLTLSLLAVVLVSCGGGVPKEGLWENATYTTDKEFGNGAKTVQVEVKAGEQSITFTIKTDKENLCDALLEHSLVSGDESEFGLYIKYVNGIQADYDVDQSYWGLTKNGEMLNTGASSTIITDGEHYEFTYTK